MYFSFKNTLSIVVALFVFLLLVKSFDISYPLTITNYNKSSELSVVGEGKIDVVPDKALINVGITVQNASTAEEAQKSINQTNNKLIQAMKSLGVNAGDIKTSNYSINPTYSSRPEATQTISGYSGNATITITLKNAALVPQALEAATKAGANEIQGVSFSIDDPNKYREEARNKAISNAKDQAEKLAKTLGIRLGKVTNIIESSPGEPNPIFKTADVMSAPSGGAPIVEPGTQTITSIVTLYFEKK